MKKFFSLIALVGMIASCTPEQIATAFKLAGGKVIVEVEVVDIINGGAYTGPYTITSNFGTVSGNTITFQANDSAPVLEGNYEVSVSGANLARTYNSGFVVPGVLAGGEAKIKVVVPVGEPLNGWTIMAKFDEENANEWSKLGFLVNGHYPSMSYSHPDYPGIDTWYYNNSEFYLEGSVDYFWEDAGSTSNKVDNNILGFEGIVNNVESQLLEAYMWDGDEGTLPVFVSAWAMWQVVQTEYHSKVPVLIWAYKDANNNGKEDNGEEHLDLGSFDFDYVYSNLITPVELPYVNAPGHAHYVAGHGQDSHGSKANAGGGISFNE